jgi:ketosteroid isomerase-like protein
MSHEQPEPARPQSRVRNWGTIGAFALIAALTIGEGIDEGFSFWDWLVIGLSVVFIVQAVSRLTRAQASP